MEESGGEWRGMREDESWSRRGRGEGGGGRGKGEEAEKGMDMRGAHQADE